MSSSLPDDEQCEEVPIDAVPLNIRNGSNPAGPDEECIEEVVNTTPFPVPADWICEE
jgi:hypothetical protein